MSEIKGSKSYLKKVQKQVATDLTKFESLEVEYAALFKTLSEKNRPLLIKL